MSKKGKYLAALALMGSGVLSCFSAPTYAAEMVACDATAISQIEEICYDDLASAVDAVSVNGTIKLLSDRAEGFTVAAGKKFTLDLNGKELDVTGNDVWVQGELTVKNGTVKGGNYTLLPYGNGILNVDSDANVVATNGGGSAIIAYTNSTVNILPGAHVEGTYGIWANGNGNTSTINVSGGMVLGKDPANGGSVGIFIHGLNKTGTGTIVNISGGTVKATHGTVGTVSQRDSQAIAQNGLSHVTISGGLVEGDEAVGVKAGTLTVTGGTLKGTGEYHHPADPNFSGTEATGAAISITSNSSYADIDTVTISGGVISSVNGSAVYEGTSSGPTKLTDGDIVITGGIFTGNEENGGAILAENVKATVTGGTSTTEPAAKDIPEGYEATLVDGVYVISPIPEVIESIEFAIDEPKAGMTVNEVNATLTVDETYITAEPIRWYVYDEENETYGYYTGGELAGETKLEGGKRYFAEFRFTPKEGYTFDETTKFLLNGKELGILPNWEATTYDWDLLETSIDLYSGGKINAVAYLEYVVDIKAPNTGGAMREESGATDSSMMMTAVGMVMALGLMVAVKRKA